MIDDITKQRCGASFCYRGNAEGVFEVTLTKTEDAKHRFVTGETLKAFSR